MRKLNSVAIILLCLLSCQNNEYKTALDQVLNDAGENRKELLKVLKTYDKNSNDSLKYRAALFLIENMLGHGTIEKQWINQDGETYAMDINKYSNIDMMRKAADSLRVYQVICPKKEDCKTISAEFMINNIELAFSVWQKYSWSKHMDFDQFCELILPYRVGTEKITEWREILRDSNEVDMINYVDSTVFETKPEFIFNLAYKLNYKYDTRANALSDYQNIDEMMKFGIGTCEDHAALGIFTARALGIPVALDFIPMWGSKNGGHARVTLIGKDGKGIIVGDHENSFKRTAKVFRRVFALQKESLNEICKDHNMVPPVLRHSRIIDATKDHCKARDIQVQLEHSPSPDTKFLFICIFNYGGWHAIDWTHNTYPAPVQFNNMGPEVFYTVATYYKGKYKLLSKPFMLTVGGNIKYFESNIQESSSFSINNNWGTRYLGELILKEGEIFNLYSWDEGWKFHSRAKTDTKVSFDNVPSHTMLRITNKRSMNTARPFFIEDGIVRWM